MAIVWGDEPASSTIVWDDEQESFQPPPPSEQVIFPQLYNAVANAFRGTTSRREGTRNLLRSLFAPAEAIRRRFEPTAQAIAPYIALPGSFPPTRGAQEFVARLPGAIAAAPVDPTTAAFVATGGLPLLPRVLASAVTGATPGLILPEEPSLPYAGLQGLIAGGLAFPGMPRVPRALPFQERLPGVSPYSVLLPGERATVEEAAAAAREAAELAVQPRQQELALAQIERPRERGFLIIPEEPVPPAVRREIAGRIVTQPAVERLQQQADVTAQRITDVTNRLTQLNERSRIALAEAPEIKRIGTLAEEQRAPFREAGPSPKTFTYQFSEEDVKQSQAEIVRLAEEVEALRNQVETGGDQLSVNVSRVLDNQMKQAVAQFNTEVKRFAKLRFAAGRAVKTFDRPPISAETLLTLEQAGAITNGLKAVKERLPIYTSLVDKFKRLGDLTPGEYNDLARDTIDGFRLNLFPVLSFVRDFLGNSTELATQAVEAAGRDVGYLIGTGNVTLPNLRGFLRAMRWSGKELPAPVAQGIGRNVVQDVGVLQGAGFGRGVGTFTRRLTPGTAVVDYLVGSPLYLKGVTDNSARRLGAWAELWSEAIKAAEAKGLRGVDRLPFYESFFANTPRDALTRVISEGNKAGFNRELGRVARWYSSNRVVQLLGDAFPRWPFQFTKAAGEWLGYNPELWSRMKAGTATPEDMFGYFAKSSTGYGMLWWLNRTVYPNVDFNSMEYVNENGNRTRLSSLDPITTGLWVLSVLRGDLDKVSGAMKYASIPFVRWADPDGGNGLFASFTNVLESVSQSGRIDPQGFSREFSDWVNRAFPGQAWLALMTTLTDPTVRQGVGANIPGISRALPPAINRATGEPLQPRQRILGREFPAVRGTAVPGGERVLDPVTQLLSRFGLLTYRSIRSPIAGVPATEVPQEWLREWQVELGKQRQRLLLSFADDPRLSGLKRGTPEYERWRKAIQDKDAVAAKNALSIVRQHHPGRTTILRQPTLRERRGPS